ncbi:MAG: VCBS repeat-containing protein, partial [Tannerella sp.]|nr:VCBS repeat-containing protein [Tannerella sp.]
MNIFRFIGGCRLMRALFSMLLLGGISFAVHAQNFVVLNDAATTGPLQKVRVNVAINDTIPCLNYRLEITSPPLDPDEDGQATVVMPGGYIDFMPGINCRNKTVTLDYKIACGVEEKSATLAIRITNYNDPVNVVTIPESVTCFDIMGSVTFGMKLKFRTEANASHAGGPGSTYAPPANNNIDGFTSPMVGDLNSDGKPEIVMLGTNEAFGGTATNDVEFLNIYNGQNGNRLISYDLGADWNVGAGGDYGIYHRSPSAIALADLDNDGTGEIILCRADSGLVKVYKPVFSGSAVTALNLMWTGKTSAGKLNYGAPNTASISQWPYPMPSVANLDGDSIPEVIVYNKIFNGRTGDLMMSWGGTATGGAASSITAGLNRNHFYASPTTSANAATIKSGAMVGCRRGTGGHADSWIPVPAIVDIDGDGQQEIICGNRIYKFTFNSLGDHTQNTYTTIEGPTSVNITENPDGTQTTHYLSDGFTRVADIDGDGFLDVIVLSVADNGSQDVKILLYVWDPRDPGTCKAATTFRSDGQYGSFSIPFIGDINMKEDGWDASTQSWERRLPEICIVGGEMHINRSTSNDARSGVPFHPLAGIDLTRGGTNNSTSSSTTHFNGQGGGSGHIIGLTWCDSAATVDRKLSVSWGMEHSDDSNNTGITLFDFDNNGSSDLVYRDQTTLRVISPARGIFGTNMDYVTLAQGTGTNS